MEIIIKFDENGRLTIKKTEEVAILSAVGMLELAKKIMLENGQEFKKEEDEVEVDVNDNM